MEKIIVKGGKKLQGEVDISVAKNSVLPIIVATILNPTPIVIKNVWNTTENIVAGKNIKLITA